ncbi:MAG: hypothetical protein QOF36_1189 [Microbacteriaceae bacterium]|nr:hypothetical protein [Microbacteriaceae bacterium]
MYPSLRNEVDPVDFLLLSWLRTAEPLLYTRLPAERLDLVGGSDIFEAFRGGTAKPSERRDHWVGLFKASKVAKRNRDGVAEVLGSLSPRFNAIWNMQNQIGASDSAPKRIANRDYFDRYFAFDVPSEHFGLECGGVRSDSERSGQRRARLVRYRPSRPHPTRDQ